MAARIERLAMAFRASDVVLQDAVCEAHRQAVIVSNREMVKKLQALFGADIIADLVGEKDQKVIGRWVRAERSLHGQRERQLRAVYQILRLLIIAFSEETARAWFFALNPLLANRAPLAILGEEPTQAAQVLAAAKDFVVDDRS